MRNKKNASALLLQHENFKLEKITFVYFFVLFMLVLLNTVEAKISCRYICSARIGSGTNVCPSGGNNNIYTVTMDDEDATVQSTTRELHRRLYDKYPGITAESLQRRIDNGKYAMECREPGDGNQWVNRISGVGVLPTRAQFLAENNTSNEATAVEAPVVIAAEDRNELRQFVFNTKEIEDGNEELNERRNRVNQVPVDASSSTSLLTGDDVARISGLVPEADGDNPYPVTTGPRPHTVKGVFTPKDIDALMSSSRGAVPDRVRDILEERCGGSLCSPQKYQELIAEDENFRDAIGCNDFGDNCWNPISCIDEDSCGAFEEAAERTKVAIAAELVNITTEQATLNARSENLELKLQEFSNAQRPVTRAKLAAELSLMQLDNIGETSSSDFIAKMEEDKAGNGQALIEQIKQSIFNEYLQGKLESLSDGEDALIKFNQESFQSLYNELFSLVSNCGHDDKPDRPTKEFLCGDSDTTGATVDTQRQGRIITINDILESVGGEGAAADQ